MTHNASTLRTIGADTVAVPPVPALTSGVSDGTTVTVTGQLAYDAVAGGVPDGLDAVAQAEIVMRRLVALLQSEGLSTRDLVRVALYVTDPADVLAVNGVYARYVTEPFPARVTIGVAFLALPGAKVEIEAVARRTAA